jgi:hypothetical protein
MTAALPVPTSHRQLATLDQLAAIPEEEIWLAKQKSKQTRRAYRLDVRHFMRALGITSADALRRVVWRAPTAPRSGWPTNSTACRRAPPSRRHPTIPIAVAGAG